MDEDLSRFCCQNAALPRPRQARGRQPDGLRPLRQAEAASAALLPHLQAPVLRAEGDAPVRLPTARGQGGLALRAPRRAVRRPATARLVGVNRNTVVRYSRLAGDARPAAPRRARGFFPLRPVRSSSTRSGRSSPRSRSTATPTTRPMTTGGTGGTTWPSTPRAGWCWPWCPGARDAEAVEEVVGEVKRADRRPCARPGDQRRLPGVRDGALERLRARRSRPRPRAGRAARWSPTRSRPRG